MAAVATLGGRVCAPHPVQRRALSRRRGGAAHAVPPNQPGKAAGFRDVPAGQQKPPPPTPPLPPPQLQQIRLPVVAPTPSSVALPQVVSDRILARMLTFTLPPLLLGFASGPAAYWARLSGNEDLSAPALISGGTFLYFLAAVGISYGVLSASWDPQRKGSALGLDEVGRNAAALADRIPFLRGRR